MQPGQNLSPKRWAVVAFGVSLSACTTLGPDAVIPAVPSLEHWSPSTIGIGESAPRDAQDTDLQFWWRIFDDPALNQLIEVARIENIGLRVAGLRVLEARARLGIAGSALYPQLQQLGAGMSYVDTRSFGGELPDEQTSFVAYQAGFSLGWELDFWGRFQRGVESADAGFFGSIANQQAAQVLLHAQVADLYFAYRTTQLRIAIARENARIQKRSYDITKKIYESGEDSELDLQQAKTQYLATLSTIPQLQTTLIQTRNALCLLLGRPPGDLPELSQPVERLPEVDLQSIRAIPARQLLRRPDIRSAAWQIAAQSAQIGIAEADYYPAISLLGSLGWSGNSLSRSPDNLTFGVGPGLTWNLFDHGRIANNIRVQDARLQQLIEQYQSLVLEAAREVDDAAIRVVKGAETQRLQRQTVVAARRALELANTRYREGYADFQRVLDAQRALFSQTEQELVSQGDQVNALIALYKGFGGGWLGPSIDSLVPGATRNAMRERSDWGDLLDAPLPVTVDGEAATTAGQSTDE